MPNLISKKIIFSTIIFLSYSYIAGQSEVAIVPDKIKVGNNLKPNDFVWFNIVDNDNVNKSNRVRFEYIYNNIKKN